MPYQFTASRAITAFDQDCTLIVVIEMGQSTWLVTGLLPGVERQPLKKLGPDPDSLFALIDRWRQECCQSGRKIERLVVAYEAGRDGSGWRDGLATAVSRRMSSIQAAWLCPEIAAVRRQIVSTRPCSFGWYSVGFAANLAVTAWQQHLQLRTRTRSVRRADAKISSASVHATLSGALASVQCIK
ncbi:hypothetical protein CXZ10_09860 [Pleomorphomonas diazotrophica]|uniref:Uncharacterized protein n=1 Tax=Pleomorphomonas diazotrophica TaxID=1166257 RepID=A0A2N3LYE2_9HYPH|nr:hypothetical protein [Pleomorphomonas diazotrophica]PKR89656.1 hypothetical protein CXZ10_09860 [Pleomorphomonas diazotrophica]